MNTLWYLGAAFIIIAPISVSAIAPGAVKYIRVLITLFMFYIYMRDGISKNLKPMSKALWIFSIVFALFAVLSDNLFWGLFNKGLFVLTTAAGLGMVYSIQSMEDLRKHLNFLGIVNSLSAATLVFLFFANPEDNIVNDRLSVAGMNANTIGAAAAPIFIFSLFLLFQKLSTFYKALHISTAVVLLAIIMATGSRGSLIMAIVGSIFILRPILKKNVFLGSIFILIPTVVYQLFTASLGEDEEATATPGFSRITSDEEKKNTRAPVWEWALKRFYDSPVVGVGWLHWGDSSANIHSIYIQVLAESGIIGGFFLLMVLIKIPKSFLNTLRFLPSSGPTYELVFFSSGLLAAHLVHGVVESSSVLGTTTNALFFAFSIGLLDRTLDLDSNATPLAETGPKLHPWAFQRNQQREWNGFQPQHENPSRHS